MNPYDVFILYLIAYSRNHDLIRQVVSNQSPATEEACSLKLLLFVSLVRQSSEDMRQEAHTLKQYSVDQRPLHKDSPLPGSPPWANICDK